MLDEGPPGDADALLADLPLRAPAPAPGPGRNGAGKPEAAPSTAAKGNDGDPADNFGGFDDYSDEPTNVDGVALIDPDMGSADPAPGSEEAKH